VVLLVDPTKERSLFNDPVYMTLVRQYAQSYEPPLRAELADVLRGHWCALLVVPGRERKTVDRIANELWLPLYVPIVHEILNVKGRLRRVPRALFVGYAFALAAPIDRYWGLVRACEGVLGLLTEAGTSRPAVIGEREIERMRMLENYEYSWLLRQLQRQQDPMTAGWCENVAKLPKRARSRRGNPPQR
jgi:transcription antitermination factor NusG